MGVEFRFILKHKIEDTGQLVSGGSDGSGGTEFGFHAAIVNTESGIRVFEGTGGEAKSEIGLRSGFARARAEELATRDIGMGS